VEFAAVTGAVVTLRSVELAAAVLDRCLLGSLTVLPV
jgi:hypothetical protein